MKNKVSLFDITRMGEAAKGLIGRIYVHWTAGRYNQCFDDYHLCITGDGEVYSMCEDFTDRKAHTWRRNTGNIGVALCCCYNATTDGTADGTDLGEYPPTHEQIEALCSVLANMCNYLDLDTRCIMTHAEIADIDGYGIYDDDPDLRWDLLFIPDYIEGGELVDGGELIRGKVEWYRHN